jgi:hypothetical protein
MTFSKATWVLLLCGAIIVVGIASQAVLAKCSCVGAYVSPPIPPDPAHCTGGSSSVANPGTCTGDQTVPACTEGYPVILVGSWYKYVLDEEGNCTSHLWTTHDPPTSNLNTTTCQNK